MIGIEACVVENPRKGVEVEVTMQDLSMSLFHSQRRFFLALSLEKGTWNCDPVGTTDPQPRSSKVVRSARAFEAQKDMHDSGRREEEQRLKT